MFAGNIAVEPIFRITEQFLYDKASKQQRKFVAGVDSHDVNDPQIIVSEKTRLTDAVDLKNSLESGELNYIDDAIEVSVDGGQSYRLLNVETEVELMNYLSFLTGEAKANNAPTPEDKLCFMFQIKQELLYDTRTNESVIYQRKLHENLAQDTTRYLVVPYKITELNLAEFKHAVIQGTIVFDEIEINYVDAAGSKTIETLSFASLPEVLDYISLLENSTVNRQPQIIVPNPLPVQMYDIVEPNNPSARKPEPKQSSSEKEIPIPQIEMTKEQFPFLRSGVKPKKKPFYADTHMHMFKVKLHKVDGKKRKSPKQAATPTAKK